jgi:hypothetical protein
MSEDKHINPIGYQVSLNAKFLDKEGKPLNADISGYEIIGRYNDVIQLKLFCFLREATIKDGTESIQLV